MKLINFEVENYRSVNASGVVEVGKVTTLVGRNESGKTNLLLGLQTLNPAGGPKDLSRIKDFPRHRRLTECTDSTPVAWATWELNSEERDKLAAVFPRAKGVTGVEVGRSYKAKPYLVDFLGLKPIIFLPEDVSAKVKQLQTVALEAAKNLEEASLNQFAKAIGQFGTQLAPTEPAEWAASAVPAIATFRQTLSTAAIELDAKDEGTVVELENLAATIAKDEPAHQQARNLIASLMPVFIYVEDYPELVGRQNIAEYLDRKAANQLTDADRNFEKMCKIADLNPQQLHELLAANDHETRNQLTNRSGAIVTAELRRLWKDRQLKVRFSPDGNHLDTFISDPNTVYDVEVNLNERSRGLKWFFSFYIAFSADTKGGSAENAILLLDEPGLHLHAASQGDLLRHLSADFNNQILFTTHSPFMVPTENLDAIRTVNLDQDSGTTVTNDPTGDSKTLFPIQAALGFKLSQSLFVGPNNLVIEGVTDFWIVSSISEYTRSKGGKALPKELTLTPAGGAQKIPYMVALLTSERLHVLVLLDDERQSRFAKEELVKSKIIRSDNIVFVTDGFVANNPTEADIEDLIDRNVYAVLVEESYEYELRGKSLALNDGIPRIAKRYEEAFRAIGLEFHKSRPARLLLESMARDPQMIMTQRTTEQFERLFSKIGESLGNHLARDAGPFR